MAARDFAPAFIKRLVWNFKHRKLKTDLKRCPSDYLKVMVAVLGKKRSLVDFGCGSGDLLLALRAHGWEGEYIGVDVSDKAIELGESLKDSKAQWFICPIEDFPVRKVDVVSFCESIYYAKDVPSVLDRWKLSAIYARIVHADRHADVLVQMDGFNRDGCIYSRLPLACIEPSILPSGLSTTTPKPR